VDARGQVASSSDEQKIRESVVLILGTQPGERMMRPTFGCDLRALVFAPANAATASLARFYVLNALTRWEPRIEVLAVVVDLQAGAANQLVIEVQYRVRATAAAQSVSLALPLTP
jgi:phage baseplate assembly protein W